MLPELESLLELQRQDSLLLEAKRRRDEVPKRREALQSAVAQARSALDQAKRDLDQARLGRRAFEKEVETFQAQAAKLELQLHAVKTNKEYQAMLHEIEGVKAKRSDQETKILESFEREESLAAALKTAERRLQEEETRLRQGEEELDRESAALDQRVHSLTQDRDAVKPRVPPALRSRYDRLAGTRDGIAVTEVKKGACGACFKALTPHAMQEARKGDTVQACEACGRIVIWVESSTV